MTIAVRDLTIRYGDHVAVENLSLQFGEGAVGLLGRNGAGKSSVLKALLGLVRPTQGTIQFAGLPADASAADVRSHVGYMPERDAWLPEVSGFDMVATLGMLSGMPRRDAWRRAHEVLFLVGLEEQRYRLVSGYSTGMRQKAKLAAALVHDPDVLLLDEPTNGLDPGGRLEMLRLVRQIAAEFGKSIVFSTHILPDVESVCGAAVVLERGRVVASGPLAQLTRGGQRQHRLTIEPASPERDQVVFAALARLGTATALGQGRFDLSLGAGVTHAEVFAAVAAAGTAVRGFSPHRQSLEDVFLSVVGGPADQGRGTT
ncbi:MAG: ABC transporter ATP-binding protein [Planctomycetes bacterium]|nr:ABC transporter ATP-binding protein [Planctomycetota bacterium]